MNIEKFYEINKLSYDRQGIEVPFSLKLFSRIEECCLANECRKSYIRKMKKETYIVLPILFGMKNHCIFL